MKVKEAQANELKDPNPRHGMGREQFAKNNRGENMILHLPRKYKPPFQKGINNTGESFKSIDDLHAFDRKKTLYKQFRRIKL